jgi:hypothetical protein
MSPWTQTTKTCSWAKQKNKQQQEQTMKQPQTNHIITKTTPGSTLADGPAALPVRRDRVFGAGLVPNAGVLALLLGLPLGASLVTAGEEPHPPQYRFTEISLPGQSYAVGINNHRTVTGYYLDPATGDWLSFVIERGELTTGIAAPGASITSLGPANNRGVEIGNYGDLTNQQAVFYDIRHGTYTPLPEVPGMPFSFGDGINDFGHASGVSYPSGDWVNGGNGLGQNWIWDGENFSFFTVPGAVNGAFAGGINNRDQVTGWYVDSSGLPQGFLKDGTNFTTIAAPGAFYTMGFGINNLGVVVGRYVDASGGHHGYRWLDGKFVTVDAPISGSLGNEWIGLNDRGDLAGLIWTAPGHTPHAVIAERLDEDADRHGEE